MLHSAPTTSCHITLQALYALNRQTTWLSIYADFAGTVYVAPENQPVRAQEDSASQLDYCIHCYAR